MQTRTKIQKIKRLLKIGIATGIFALLFVLGLFVKINYTFENSNMKRWGTLAEQDRIMTIQRVVPNAESQDLLLECITKISALPNSNEMLIRDATVLCYNGIKLNPSQNETK